jgi:acyl carrier protein
MVENIDNFIKGTFRSILIKMLFGNSLPEELVIDETTDIIQDLGADSLDLIEIVMECEDTFDLDSEIPNEELANLSTVGDCEAFILKTLKEQHSLLEENSILKGIIPIKEPEDTRSDYEKASELGLTNVNRWEDGIEHHPSSERLVRFIAEHDFNDYDDYFCWKVGGDGDNGETLMYMMDAFFEMLDGVDRRKDG